MTGTLARPNGEGMLIIGPTTSGTIGGDNAITRNIVSGNSGFGVRVLNAAGVFIEGNYIGVDATGVAALPNLVGVRVEGGVAHVGDIVPGQYNVISGNTLDGILVTGGAAGNRIDGNYVGTDQTTTFSVPNGGSGLVVSGGAPLTGANFFLNNGVNGVRLTGAVGGIGVGGFAYGTTALDFDLGGDGITPNDNGTQDADAGPNGLQNFPVINAASELSPNTEISGSLDSAANTTFTINVYETPTCHASGSGGGRIARSSFTVLTNGAGIANFNHVYAGINVGNFVTAVAVDPSGNTSEFSVCRVITP